MKNIDNILKLLIGISLFSILFYPNNYTVGIYVLLVLFNIFIIIKRKPKKTIKYICILFGLLAIILFYYYLVIR